MRHTTEDTIEGLKFLKSIVRKTKNQHSQHFHFLPNSIWVYDGENGGSIECGVGFTGCFTIKSVMDAIKEPPSSLADILPSLEINKFLSEDCPFPTNSQLIFDSSKIENLSESLKECYKELDFRSWEKCSVLLGNNKLLAVADGKKYIHDIGGNFGYGRATVIPERFGKLISKFGDPSDVRAKKFIKATFDNYPIKRHLFSASSDVVSLTTETIDTFKEHEGDFHFLNGKIIDKTCTKCELSYQCSLETNKMPGEGFHDGIMFVGKHPGKDDDKIGSPMTGPNGKLFWELLRSAGYVQGEVFVTNCIKCAPVDISAGKRHWNYCSEHFLAELEEVKPKMVVAVGAEALTFLTGKTGVQGLRGTGLTCSLNEDYVVYPIRQPMALKHVDDYDQEAMKASMVDDLRNLRRILHTGGVVSVDSLEDDTDYRVAYTDEDVDAFLKELENAPALACDLETTGLEEWAPGAEIVAIGFSSGPGHGRAIPVHAVGIEAPFWWDGKYVEETLIPKIVEFLRKKEKVLFGHNFLKFDNKWLRRFWKCDPVDIGFDTLLGAYATWHNLKSFELEVLANSKCGMRKWKKEFTLENTEQLCLYLCKDVDGTFRVKDEIEKDIDPAERWLLENILVPLTKEFSYMEQRGARIDREQIDEVDTLLEEKIKVCRETIRSIDEVKAWEAANGMEFNPDSPQQVGEIMFDKMKLPVIKKSKKTGKPSADKEVLGFYKNNEFCKSVIEFKGMNKLRSTYVIGIKDSLDGELIHTSYKSWGTVTGRPSSSGPNLMNIPRGDTAGKVMEDGEAIKKLFIPREGNCFVQADYSQVELRVLACLSGDKNMIDIFKRGGDLHYETASKAYGIPVEQVSKAQRTNAKMINFGLIYGKHLETLKQDFIDAGSSAEDAVDFYNAHQREFPGVWQFMKDQEYKVIADGQQTTYFGRTRQYDEKNQEAFRQAYNTPVQSMASDLTLISIIRLVKAFKQLGIKAFPILTVYDSIICEVELSEFWKACDVIKDVMESIDFSWIKVPIVADLSAGPNWGELISVDTVNRKLLGKDE